MKKVEFLDDEVNRIATERGNQEVADILVRIRILMMTLLKKMREFADHPHGGDPRAIDAGHENERSGRLARETEISFVVIAGLIGGVFLWLAITTGLPWWLVLPIVVAIWLAFCWAITKALRSGLRMILRVNPSNPKSEKYCLFIFGLSFAGFLVFLVAFTLSRFMAMGSPDLIGLEQTLVETFALLCAASAGALRAYYEPIVELVEEIRTVMRELASLRAKAEAVSHDVAEVDRVLSVIAANSLAETNGTSRAGKSNGASEVVKVSGS